MKVKVFAILMVMGAFLIGAVTAPDVEDMKFTDQWCEKNCAECHGSY